MDAFFESIVKKHGGGAFLYALTGLCAVFIFCSASSILIFQTEEMKTANPYFLFGFASFGAWGVVWSIKNFRRASSKHQKEQAQD
jgi:hypothetical protein